MWMVKPWDVQGIYTYVFVLLDDIKLLPSQPQNPSQLQSPSQNPSQTTSRKKRLKSYSLLTLDQSLQITSYQSSSLSNHSSSFKSSALLNSNYHLLLSFTQSISPMVIGANTGAGQAFRTIMQRPGD